MFRETDIPTDRRTDRSTDGHVQRNMPSFFIGGIKIANTFIGHNFLFQIFATPPPPPAPQFLTTLRKLSMDCRILIFSNIKASKLVFIIFQYKVMTRKSTGCCYRLDRLPQRHRSFIQNIVKIMHK